MSGRLNSYGSNALKVTSHLLQVPSKRPGALTARPVRVRLQRPPLEPREPCDEPVSFAGPRGARRFGPWEQSVTGRDPAAERRDRLRRRPGLRRPRLLRGEGDETPNLDRLAREGRRFTNFHVAPAVCSASRRRAADRLLSRTGSASTGRSGRRPSSGSPTARRRSPRCSSRRGTPPAWPASGTSAIARRSCPTRHGFDEYFGLPYSNDMWPHHPEAKPGTYPAAAADRGRDGRRPRGRRRRPGRPHRPLHRPRRSVHRAEQGPAVLLLPGARDAPRPPVRRRGVRGQVARGLFGDVIEEIDWSVGEILEGARRTTGWTRDTLVIFTSDNGPWLSYGDHAGSRRPAPRGEGDVLGGRGPRPLPHALAGQDPRRHRRPTPCS